MLAVARSAFLVLALAGCGGSSGPASPGRVLIQNKGSDTLLCAAQAWAETYAEVEPGVAVAVTGGGSGTGIAALLGGTVDLANASRRLDPSERALAAERAIDPVEHVVGFDALAVFVHEANPAPGITFEELGDVFGEGGTARLWSDLGLSVPGCGSDRIIRVSRQNSSGTYAYFRDAVLGKRRDMGLGSLDMHGSKDVVDLVAHTPCSIGYSGLAYAAKGTRMLCVSRAAGEPCVEPSLAHAMDGSYPIARPLLMYTAGPPSGEAGRYLEWILSDAGQCVLRSKGYAPVRGDLACE